MYGPQTEVADLVHSNKYRLEGESFAKSQLRLATVLADDEPHFNKLSNILLNQRFLPGGRIQAAIGSPRQVTAINCFVMPNTEDSMTTGPNSIMGIASKAAETMRLGGGVGYYFGNIRPKGDKIHSVDAVSSGPISFMHILDAMCKTISSAGNRRGAQMMVMPISHPDIFKYIEVKHNTTELTAFNLSIAVTDEFMNILKEDGVFPLTFNGKVYRGVKASELWDKIMESTWDWAEPGVIFIDTMNRFNNLEYCETIYTTNPCVTGDTFILTTEGHVTIESVIDNDITVWNGKEWSQVRPYVSGRNKKIVEISFSDGRVLKCTTNHTFVLKDGVRTQALNLEIGDKLEKHELPVIENGYDVEKAYTQGFFSGDGWLKNNSGGYIGLYGDKKELVRYLQPPKSINEYKISGGFEGTNTDETKLYLYYGINYFEPKAYIPNNWSVKSRLAWLAGLADSDGTLTKDFCVQITNKDKEFLLGVALMLQTLGINCPVCPTKDYWRLNISANNVSKLLELGFETYRLDLTSFVEPNREDARFVQVTKIRHTNLIADKVYCFTEPKNNTGVFDGVYTGNCSEQPLPPNGCCLLGSFNLTKYLTKDRAFNFGQFVSDIPVVVRAMDNVIDNTIYPLKEQEMEEKNKRRMGLGYTGLANTLEIMGFPYGSKEFLTMHESIAGTLMEAAYIASVELASEKRPFPLYNGKYLDSLFVKNLRKETRDVIRLFGIRNSHLISIAPTGSISLTADNVSSGIEPVFSYEYERDIQTPEGKKTFKMEDYAYKFYGVKGKLTKDVTIDEHLAVLEIANRFCDSAVSKTCNVPANMSFDEFKKVYFDAWEKRIKAVSTFNVNGKRFGVMRETIACYIDPETGEKDCG